MDRVMPSAGEWKSLPNGVAGIATCPPAYVPAAMEALVGEYLRFKPTLENIARLHARYETIHPFADGNGRTGRAMVFREPLRAGLVPIIVTDETHGRYYDALASAARGSYEGLFSYFKDMQRDCLRTFAALLPDRAVRDEVGRHIEIRPGDVPRQGEFQGAFEPLAYQQRRALSAACKERDLEDGIRPVHERS